MNFRSQLFAFLRVLGNVNYAISLQNAYPDLLTQSDLSGGGQSNSLRSSKTVERLAS